MTSTPAADGHRSGFATLVGRPNAGKSTLINALVGRDVVITSDRPQTTRRTVRAILTRPDGQLIVVDTPGLHRPRTLLGERLNDRVYETWSQVDTIGICWAANEKTGPGDVFLLDELASRAAQSKRSSPSVFLIITKIDTASPAQIAARLSDGASAARERNLSLSECVPVSAVTGDGVDVLAQLLVGTLPEGPRLYPVEMTTDEPEETLVAELIRQATLERLTDELPHSVAVTVDEYGPRAGRPDSSPLIDIYATIHVERESQKGIVIGKRGAVLKAVGAQARPDLERLLGAQVFLHLHVRVAKNWQRDPRQLRRLGFGESEN